MLTSFSTALSGLNNNALAINVIGNNLANANTTSFKAGRTTFAELLGGVISTSTNGNPIQQGNGAYVPGILQVNTQGTMNYTGRETDVAISGNGFFVLDTNGGNAFCRAGNFGVDEGGNLVNIDGFTVLGYPAVNGVIDNNSKLEPISVNIGLPLAPRATSEMGMTVNLDSRAEIGATFTTSAQVIDSLGSTHTFTVTYTKGSNTGWGWTATLPAVDTGGAATAAPVVVGTGSLTFDNSGNLTAPAANPTLSATGLSNGAADLRVTFQMLKDNGQSRITGFGSDSSVSTTNQNGYTSSVLKSITIGSDGVVGGIFENGQVQPLAQLALATFPNVDGLLKVKGATYYGSLISGSPSIGAADTGGRGSIQGNTLEMSNVDIAKEFTDLIVAQRGYQANSRIITTTDELYQDVINLKR
jgi:flagellar hook protein FlgE